MFARSLLAVALLIMTLAPAYGQTHARIEQQHRAWIENALWPQARLAGVSRSTFDAARGHMKIDWTLPGLVYPGRKGNGPEQHQSEFRAPRNYFNENAMESAARLGVSHSDNLASVLGRIERDTGVPWHVLLAIWGRESLFGKAPIPHEALRVLATRAYLDPRPSYYANELISALLLLEHGNFAPGALKSSWGGALGMPQFMPSSALRYARDADGDGKADIFRSEADTLASIAHYLESHGWVSGRDWGFEVSLPAALPCSLEGPDQMRSIADWERLGVTRVSGRKFPAHERMGAAYLVLPAGRYGPAFLATPNFGVLKDYNNSDLYALYVGNLADRIRYGSGSFRTEWKDIPGLGRQDVAEIQRRLVAQGYDVGGVDGLVGFKTRRAIGKWQEKANVTPTCFPTRATFHSLAKR